MREQIKICLGQFSIDESHVFRWIAPAWKQAVPHVDTQEVLPKVCRKRASVPSRNVVKDVRYALRLEWFELISTNEIGKTSISLIHDRALAA